MNVNNLIDKEVKLKWMRKMLLTGAAEIIMADPRKIKIVVFILIIAELGTVDKRRNPYEILKFILFVIVFIPSFLLLII